MLLRCYARNRRRRNLLIKFEAAPCCLMNEEPSEQSSTLAVYLTSAGIGANLKQSATARDTIMFTMTAAMALQSFQVVFKLMFKGGSSKNDKCLCEILIDMF